MIIKKLLTALVTTIDKNILHIQSHCHRTQVLVHCMTDIYYIMLRLGMLLGELYVKVSETVQHFFKVVFRW